MTIRKRTLQDGLVTLLILAAIFVLVLILQNSSPLTG